MTKHGNVHCDWFIRPPLLLLTPTIWFSLDYEQNMSDRVVNRVRGKWKHSDSSDSDSIKIMTLLTTLTFDFTLGHKRSYNSAYDSDSVASQQQP